MNQHRDVDDYGVTDGFHDVNGEWHETRPEVRAALHQAMGPFEPAPPMWFVVEGSRSELRSPCHLILEDGSDWGAVSRLPADLPIGYHILHSLNGGPSTKLFVSPQRCPAPPPGWGVAVQLYSLFSSASQGIGDLADLGALAVWLADHGGTSILLSPLHAPSPGEHQQDSPYYPASRLWRNPLHLRVPDLEPTRPRVIDRDETWRTKRAALFAQFTATATSADAPWRKWAGERGTPLGAWARWCAAQEGHQNREVREFHAWLQWCIDAQLGAARAAAPGVSLIGDIAIGFDPSGADAAAFATDLAHGCRIGAPPDQFNPAGQDWGLPPFVPFRLRAAGYEPFIATIRAVMRGMQGIRIDHVMGLFRQYVIPPGFGGEHGAYVRFRPEELLSIVAIEATRAGAFVVGEDLGTVEKGVREQLRDRGILGTTVAWFTDEEPESYPVESLATLTTHDLPTIAGVWRGFDGDAGLLERLQRFVRADHPATVGEAVVAAHRRLGQARSTLKLATLDDLCLAERRPNVPGTTIERPNWRIPLPMTLEEITRSSVIRRVADVLST